MLVALLYAHARAIDLVQRRNARRNAYAATDEHDAVEVARALLAREEAENGEASLQVGMVLDALVESLWRAARLGEETVELARRAVAIHTAAEINQRAGLPSQIWELARPSLLATGSH